MATFHFDLVSPEQLAFSGQVEQVDIPGAEGDVGIMAGHSPAVIALRPGIMTVTTGGKQEKIIVLGGIAEVSEKGLTVLADTATSVSELDREAFAKDIEEMEEKLSGKEGNALDRAIERLDQFKVIQQNITSTAMH
ncbi:F0F1 ATP synthase subunit epsilon [Tardiphaga sp.]|jgi:F-type H+-transporting ATPase subunit epsilon|uniref:F0F1 ATP synthase subunit epsilon n=1 Tax=Tardiphaga sp. TaxID=1926292 RepID=UPI0037D9C4B4